MKNNFNLNIETLVLVAIWNYPFVFQGRFNIINTRNDSNQLLFFCCECSVENKMDILNLIFSPYDYKFTHLHDAQSEINLAENDNLDPVIYLLKYALKETIKKLITNSNHQLIHIDEIAMSAISQQIKNHISSHGENKISNDNIGFAVSISFTPTESVAEHAAMKLLTISQYSELNKIMH